MIDYFDASVVVPILILEPHRAAVLNHVTQSREPPHLSDFVVTEVSSAVSRFVRMNQMHTDEGDAVLSDLDEWVRVATELVEVDPSDVREATLLVRRFDLRLRAPDALHIAVCRRLGARLVTLDNHLARAAHAVDVACINPAADSAYRKTE